LIEPSIPHDWIGRFRLETLPSDAWVVTAQSVAALGRGDEP
jgi:hypothetical protein